jgi:hypothetical protein
MVETSLCIKKISLLPWELESPSVEKVFVKAEFCQFGVSRKKGLSFVWRDLRG